MSVTRKVLVLTGTVRAGNAPARDAARDLYRDAPRCHRVGEPGVVHIGGATPRPTLMRGEVRVPSACFVAAAMKIGAPGLSSLFSPGT
jgi:hypothetical protein